MEHSSHHHSPLARLKRRATYMLAFLIVVAGSYLALSTWGDSITGVTTGIPVDEAPPPFVVSATLALPESGFDVNDATLKITLGAEEAEGVLLVDGLNLESYQGASLVFNGYTGHVASGNGSLLLDGEATSAIVNTVVVNKGGVPISVETFDLHFDSVTVSGISVKSFSLVSTGKVDVADKGSFVVQNEKVNFKAFNGAVDIDGAGLRLTGTVSGLVIDGDPRVSIE